MVSKKKAVCQEPELEGHAMLELPLDRDGRDGLLHWEVLTGEVTESDGKGGGKVTEKVEEKVTEKVEEKVMVKVEEKW